MFRAAELLCACVRVQVMQRRTWTGCFNVISKSARFCPTRASPSSSSWPSPPPPRLHRCCLTQHWSFPPLVPAPPPLPPPLPLQPAPLFRPHPERELPGCSRTQKQVQWQWRWAKVSQRRTISHLLLSGLSSESPHTLTWLSDLINQAPTSIGLTVMVSADFSQSSTWSLPPSSSSLDSSWCVAWILYTPITTMTTRAAMQTTMTAVAAGGAVPRGHDGGIRGRGLNRTN